MIAKSSPQTTKSSNVRIQFTKKKRINVIVTTLLNAYFSNNSTLISKRFQNSQINKNEFRSNEKKETCEKIEFFDSIIGKVSQ